MYLRCPECDRVGVLGYRRGGVRDEPAARNLVKAPMPPEYRCRWCQEFSAWVQGDEIDLDDPAVDVVQMICLAPAVAGDPLVPFLLQHLPDRKSVV